MPVSALPLPDVVRRNEQEYGPRYAWLRFPSPAEARGAADQRRELLESLQGRALMGCRRTKLDCADLAPGCRLCTRGVWSCLFVNGRCNARCFYCPTRQDEVGVPTTNTLTFADPQSYVEYVERLRYRGVSLSGGEPLLTLETTLSFARAVKRRFGAAVHLWVYTNGILATPEVLAQLRDAGVDEIRFDIGATGYDLGRARRAVGVIATVTVEIPAVPEDVEVVRGKLAEMADSGIQHLNLHQLRLTPHNYDQLVGRGYTFLHGERVTVLESELAALGLLCHALNERLDLPLNYCSFVYKNRFQRAAARQRAGLLVLGPQEEVTQAGFIRSLHLTGTVDRLQSQARRLAAAGVTPDLWSLSGTGDRLQLASQAWQFVDPEGPPAILEHWEARLRQGPSGRHACTPLELGGATFCVERVRQEKAVSLTAAEVARFGRLLAQEEDDATAAGGPPWWPRVRDREFVEAGLQEYG
ncbi:MAG: radical SAM protein [Candidatus Latescibacterota bacterium]